MKTNFQIFTDVKGIIDIFSVGYLKFVALSPFLTKPSRAGLV